MKRILYPKWTSFPINNFPKKKRNDFRSTKLYTFHYYNFTLRTDWFRYPPSALEPHRKWLVKTAEWHCVCRYIRWALVFHYGDAAVTSLVKPVYHTRYLDILNNIFHLPQPLHYYTLAYFARAALRRLASLSLASFH